MGKKKPDTLHPETVIVILTKIVPKIKIANQALYNVTGSRYVKPYKILTGFQ